MMVQKLSGFAKFDLDTKVSGYQFFKFVEALCSNEREIEKLVEKETGETELVTEKVSSIDNEKYNYYIGVFEKAFKEGQPPYAGDLENEQYKQIL